MTPWEIILNQLESTKFDKPAHIVGDHRSKTGFPGVITRAGGVYEATGIIHSERKVLYWGRSLKEAIEAKKKFEIMKAALLKEKEVI
jgi:hypothetical protein